ncbi:MAG: hypothetical protein JJT89_12095 [Nitriliruptoraceae bacterium]|nr:hypothetical protein [Nitriliruptoraceae bacterium]
MEAEDEDLAADAGHDADEDVDDRADDLDAEEDREDAGAADDGAADDGAGEDGDTGDDEPQASFDDPPLVNGEPLSSDAITAELLALLEQDLADREVCAALGVDQARLRALSLAGVGFDYLSEDDDLYEQVLVSGLWCVAPTTIALDDGGPGTLPGVGVEVFTFTPSEADTSFSADTLTAPAGRLVLAEEFQFDPNRPDAGMLRTVSVFSVAHGVGVRAIANENAPGSDDATLAGLLDEVLDHLA